MCGPFLIEAGVYAVNGTDHQVFRLIRLRMCSLDPPFGRRFLRGSILGKFTPGWCLAETHRAFVYCLIALFETDFDSLGLGCKEFTGVTLYSLHQGCTCQARKGLPQESQERGTGTCRPTGRPGTPAGHQAVASATYPDSEDSSWEKGRGWDEWKET